MMRRIPFVCTIEIVGKARRPTYFTEVSRRGVVAFRFCRGSLLDLTYASSRISRSRSGSQIRLTMGDMYMRIAIVGAGYVGLVSGACLADLGHDVTCIDKDKSKIAALRRGETPIFEPGLAEMIARNVHGRRLTFDSSPR